MKNLFLLIAIAILFSVSAFAADGDIDTTFNGSGSRLTDIGSTSNDVIFNIGLMPDGRIVGMGSGNGQTAVIRYLPIGALDTSFSGDGIATAFTGSGSAGALQTDGKPVVAGTSAAGLQVVRYNTDGTLDTSFGGDGQVTTSFTGGVTARSLMIQTDGKIVVAGYLSFTSGDFRDIMLARYETDGTLDATFGTGGTAIIDLTPNGVEIAFDAVMLSDGKIIIVGQKNDTVGFADFLVARFNSNASVDTTFGTNGFTTVAVAPSNNDLADSVAIAPDGKIVVGGIYSDIAVSNAPAIVRLNSDGSPDSTFDGDGILQPTSVNRPVAILVQSDRKILTAGTNGSISGLSKYNVDGTLDTSFSLDGRIPVAGSATSLAIQPDGKILVSGSQTIAGGNTGFLTSRFLNTVAPTTAASVTISGKVSTANGNAVSRATIHLTDQNGNIRTAKTNSFGYFRLTEIEAGQTFVVNVFHREFQFAPRVLSVNEDLYDLDFIAADY
ncbi:MAG TPA: carboxypeptidase regulatory-like domain-containing protein [Pyrinomonadaceae bacterium]|nr:carboxypeptidase regulatory-like domain-containing protein [Pyrinomonadaceae bacterium]